MIRPFIASTLVLLAGTLLPSPALAGGTAPTGAAGCPPHMICDTTLGVAISRPSGWFLLPAGKFRPHSLAFANGTSGQSYNIRLLIEPYALTSVANNRAAAQLVAQKLMQAEGLVAVARQSVTYGGSTGILFRGAPRGPGPVAHIILAHNKAVYLITAPGKALGSDQRAALGSLRFIPRTGHFLPPVGGGR